MAIHNAIEHKKKKRKKKKLIKKIWCLVLCLLPIYEYCFPQNSTHVKKNKKTKHLLNSDWHQPFLTVNLFRFKQLDPS